MTSLTVVIPSFNTRSALRSCIETLKTTLPMSSEIVVVDRCSSDGSVRMLAEQFRHVRLIKNSVNNGLASAVNQGIEAARGAYVLLLDPRTQVVGPAIRTMLAFLEQNLRYGACTPRVTEQDGTTQRSVCRFPSLWTPLFVGTPLERLFPDNREQRRYLALDFDYEADADVEHAPLACLLMRRKALKRSKPLDERLGRHFDGLDLCRRLCDSSWRIRYLSQIHVVFAGEIDTLVSEAAEDRADRDRLAYFRKHHGRAAGAWLKACVAISVLDVCVREFWRRAEGNPEESLMPLWDSFQVFMKH
jgi:GT2 family glycosyltransferase